MATTMHPRHRTPPHTHIIHAAFRGSRPTTLNTKTVTPHPTVPPVAQENKTTKHAIKNNTRNIKINQQFAPHSPRKRNEEVQSAPRQQQLLLLTVCCNYRSGGGWASTRTGETFHDMFCHNHSSAGDLHHNSRLFQRACQRPYSDRIDSLILEPQGCHGSRGLRSSPLQV